MATEIVQLVWCDPCMRAGNKTEAKAIGPLQIGNVRGELDMCEHHEETLLSGLRELLRGNGRKSDGKPVRSRDEEKTLGCILCTTMFSSGPTQSMHLNQVHKTTALALLGLRCPLCETAFAHISQLGSHGRAHGCATAMQLFWRAQQEGDEFNIVAERVKLYEQT